MANGKWNHMMDQTHIGTTLCQGPPRNSMPAVKEIELPAAAAMGVAIEGMAGAWPTAKVSPVLPGFDVFNQPRRYIDVFNRGKAPFEFTATATAPWILLSATKGTVEKEQRLWGGVDSNKAPRGTADGSGTVARAGSSATFQLQAGNPQTPTRRAPKRFVEAHAY